MVKSIAVWNAEGPDLRNGKAWLYPEIVKDLKRQLERLKESGCSVPKR